MRSVASTTVVNRVAGYKKVVVEGRLTCQYCRKYGVVAVGGYDGLIDKRH